MLYYPRHTIRVDKINLIRLSTLPRNWRRVLQMIVAAVTQNYRFRMAESIWIFLITKTLSLRRQQIVSLMMIFPSVDNLTCLNCEGLPLRKIADFRRGKRRGGEGRGVPDDDWNGISCRLSNLLLLQTPSLQCLSLVWTDFDKWLKAVTTRQTTNEGWLWLSSKTWNSSQAKAVVPEISFSAERRDPWIWLPVQID